MSLVYSIALAFEPLAAKHQTTFQMSILYAQALKTLGVEPASGASDVSEKEIRQAYAKLIKTEARPDVNPERFAEVRKAFDTALTEHKLKKSAAKNANKIAGEINSDVPALPKLDLKDGSDNRSKHVSSLVKNLKIDLTDNGSSAVVPDKSLVDSIIDRESTAAKPENIAPSTRAVTTEDRTQRIDASLRDEKTQNVEGKQRSVTEQDKDTQQNVDVSTAHTDEAEAIEHNFKIFHTLLRNGPTKNKKNETELLQLCDKILEQGKSVSVIREQKYLERLANEVSEQDAAPLSLVKKLVVDLELEGRAILSTAPTAYSMLQKKHNDMLLVKAFEDRAYNNNEFERHFIHGGKPPQRLGSFPTEAEKKKYGETIVWLMFCRPSRTDLIHPDARLVAEGKYVAPANQYSKDMRFFLGVCFAAVWLIFAVVKFDMPESSKDRMINDIMNPESATNSEVQSRVAKLRNKRILEKYPEFTHLHDLTFREVWALEFAVKEESMQQLNEDMSNAEFKKFVVEDNSYLYIWKALVRSKADVRYRTNIPILEFLEETSRIKNQTVVMPDGLKIRIRKGGYTFYEPE